MSEQTAEENIFGPKIDEPIGECRTLHNEKLHNLYTSPDIIYGDEIKEDEMGGTCSILGEKRNAHRIFVEVLKERGRHL
jgi:hypothetical protein